MSGTSVDDPDFEILEIIDLNTGPVDGQPAVPAPSVPAPAAAAAKPRPNAPGAVPYAVREQVKREATCSLLRDLLGPLDALESCIRERPDPETLEQGVRMALRSLWNVFRPHGLERIEGHGMPFDPRLHEAAEITPSERVPVNTVLETLRVGYTLSGQLVRPAMVRVSVQAPRAPLGSAGEDNT